ncbi:MAG: rhomboid family intramembrane serine protease, partial [Acidobacteriota bacterium]|nr:rhomboid family intramembrane serine protease [Acidobacteriota bacterium]
MATCYRHPSRETRVSCSSCGRPICPDCMTTMSVGMRCPDCARERTRVHTLRSTVRRPQVTLALIAINVVAFLTERGQLGVGGSSGLGGAVVEEGVLVRQLFVQRAPGLLVERLPIAHEHQYWRLITSAFL